MVWTDSYLHYPNNITTKSRLIVLTKDKEMSLQRPALWQIPQLTQAQQPVLQQKIAVLQQRLQQIADQHQQVKFAHSLAVEDMVIMDVLSKLNTNVTIFTLDTGRLNQETLDFLHSLQQTYPDLPVVRYQPDQQQITEYIQQYGKNGFYDSVASRKQCCYIRKVIPLNQALQDADAWLTGQRQSQSVTRQSLEFAEWDHTRQIAKYNPIFDWSEQDVWTYILQFNLPFNALYQQGYPSIGCEPCTRPVKQGEEIRAGRWWWENQASKECGLHQA